VILVSHLKYLRDVKSLKQNKRESKIFIEGVFRTSSLTQDDDYSDVLQRRRSKEPLPDSFVASLDVGVDDSYSDEGDCNRQSTLTASLS
jgi:hypothetical protein